MNPETEQAYRQILREAKELFRQKTQDYGTAWRILRLPSITDQIYIKARRIRTIQEKGQQKVADDLHSEFIGIINYCVMALIQLELPEEEGLELPWATLEPHYDQQTEGTLALLLNKNHDYGEAWRQMRISSMTDLILMKLLRVKQIEDHQGKTLASEGVEPNYRDMTNYAVFCLIKMSEEA